MSRPKSEATQIRHLKREVAGWHKLAADALAGQTVLRERAAKAEAELADWKKRFDALLKLGVGEK